MAKATYRQMRDLISARKAFQGNSLRAEHVNNIEYVHPGQLDNEETKILRSVSGPAYVVFSYATPIAWVPLKGRTRIVEQKFSRTTSRGQSLVRAWL